MLGFLLEYPVYMSETGLQQKFIETAQGQIFYHTDRSFVGTPTVVFLHGLSSNHTTWINIMAKLHESGYNSLALDLRGHGHSDKRKHRANYKFPIFSADLKQILDQENLNKVILAGYSFGGYIALDFINRHPKQVAGLILISVNYVSVLKYKHLIFLRPALWLFFNLLAVSVYWQFRNPYIYFQHRASKGFWHSLWIGLNTMPLTLNCWLIIETGMIDFTDVLSKISIPTIIVKAPRDPYLSLKEARYMQTQVKDSELIIVKNTNHFLATHAQAEISETIIKFLHDHANRNF